MYCGTASQIERMEFRSAQKATSLVAKVDLPNLDVTLATVVLTYNLNTAALIWDCKQTPASLVPSYWKWIHTCLQILDFHWLWCDCLYWNFAKKTWSHQPDWVSLCQFSFSPLTLCVSVLIQGETSTQPRAGRGGMPSLFSRLQWRSRGGSRWDKRGERGSAVCSCRAVWLRCGWSHRNSGRLCDESAAQLDCHSGDALHVCV